MISSSGLEWLGWAIRADEHFVRIVGPKILEGSSDHQVRFGT